jgi:phospholipid/cholesterol/gamma-HCH transport system substrate-binding protein
MGQKNKELWVGLLVFISLGTLVAFFGFLGGIRPFGSVSKYSVYYQFAGGVEVGAPVRVSGVKVGKVEKIEFVSASPQKELEGTSVRLEISVEKEAQPLIKMDSKFFINIAGIIGERYVEITPGESDSPQLEAGAKVRGMDPPRVDQLLSQGYGVFGRIQEFLEKNENNLQDLLSSLQSLMADTNTILKKLDKNKVSQLVDNLNEVSANFAVISRSLRSPRGKKFVDQLSDLVDRAHQIDKPTLKRFLQEEGVRARIF